MTPYEFGRLVKVAVETGGFGEYLGQNFDQAAGHVARAMGIETQPQMWGAGPDTPAPAAPRASRYRDPSTMPGPSPAPNARPRRAYADPSTMPGPSASRPAAPVAAPAAPPARPAVAPTAPAQPKPTAPGVRRASGRVA